MKINIYKTNKVEFYKKEKYSELDICTILNISRRISKKIKQDIITTLKRKGEKIPNPKYYKIDKDILFNYIEKNYDKKYKEKASPYLKKEKDETKEDILNRPLLNERDVRLLLNCSSHVSTKITSDVRKIMIKKGIEPLLGHILTSYLLKYLNDNGINYL